MPENAPRGYQVGIVNAFDADIGNNAVVAYTVISDWGNDVFTLNPQTGVFTLTARLDYEDVSRVDESSNFSLNVTTFRLFSSSNSKVFFCCCCPKFLIKL